MNHACAHFDFCRTLCVGLSLLTKASDLLMLDVTRLTRVIDIFRNDHFNFFSMSLFFKFGDIVPFNQHTLEQNPNNHTKIRILPTPYS
jgi:hypothetical protein